MRNKQLQIEQLNQKFNEFSSAAHVVPPATGWLKAIRVSLGMSLQQLADKLSISKQSVSENEIREKEGRITLNTLNDMANALDMKLVYGLIPKDGTIDDLIERKAEELATRIVSRTANTMKLEDQEISNYRLQQAIRERTEILKAEMPKILWD